MEKGSLSRSKEFYSRLKEYKEVLCVPSSYSSFDLIDNSRAVATAGGTAGWEAIIRAKPALVFGCMWYTLCKSVFQINSLESLEISINKIYEGYVPDIEDIKKYAQAIYLSTKKINFTATWYEEDIKKIKNIENEMQSVADFFYESYQKFY